MQIRKWLALLVSAALALSLLAGCGNGSKALSDVIADLLSGQYANVTVEIDPDLEGDLRQAVHEGETDAEIHAALEKILGSGVSFRLIGDGQQGDSAWDLILYPGSDPDAAARSAFTEWNKVFGSLPRDGQYTAQIAMIETDNGYAILVKATVDKAASRDDDDDDDEPEDEKVEGDGFTYNVTQKTITMEANSEETNGLQNLLTGQDGEDEKITAARNSGFEKITIELAAGEPYTVSNTFTTAFKGILKGEDEDNKATINIAGDCDGLFAQIGEEGGGPDDNGKVENITFDVQTDITNTYADRGGSCVAGAVAGLNHGNITNCDVTINSNSGCTIQATASELSVANAGGLVGWNYGTGTITACKVTINGSISASATDGHTANAGGIAGDNEGEGKIEGNSQVTLNSGGSIQAQATGTWSVSASAGGLVGQNTGTVTKTATYSGTGTDTIKAKVEDEDEDENYEASVPYTDDKDTTHCTKTDVKARAGTMIGFDWRADEPGPVSKL